MSLTASVLGCWLAAAPASPETSSSSPSGPSDAVSPATAAAYPLAEAEAALRAGIHKKCVELAQQGLASGRLAAADVARAWLVRGRCHALDGDVERAERAYAVAIRVQPDLVFPTDDPVWERVRPEGSAPASALTLAAATTVVDGAGGAFVAVAVQAHDDLGLGRAFVLVNDDHREVARAPLERPADGAGDGGSPPAHRFSGIPVEGLRARLLDRHGNVLRDVPVVVDDAARAALVAAGGTPASSAPAPTSWLTLVGAGTAAVGFVGALAGGVVFAAEAPADDDGAALPALVGFVGGVGLFVVGGALITVDALVD